MTDTYTRKRISPRNGPSVIFHGNLIAETQWDAGNCDMRFEVWETRGGAYIAATFWINGDGPNDTESEVTVVEPIYRDKPLSGAPVIAWQGESVDGPLTPIQSRCDDFAMQCAVLGHFGWHHRARSMVRDALKWRLSREVA